MVKKDFIDSLDKELSPEDVEKLLADNDFGEADNEMDADTDDMAEEKANPDISAKDGKHTIPYEVLIKAREYGNYWKQKAEEAQSKLDGMNSSKQADSSNPDSKGGGFNLDDEDDDDFFPDKKGIESIVGRIIDKKIAEALKPLKDYNAKREESEHFKAIKNAHPDADAIAESKELSDWIDSLPAYARKSVNTALSEGSAEDVINVLDGFKESEYYAGKDEDEGMDEKGLKRAAKSITDKLKPKAPTTSSSIGSSSSVGSSEFDALKDASPDKLADIMSGWDVAKIERYLNSL